MRLTAAAMGAAGGANGPPGPSRMDLDFFYGRVPLEAIAHLNGPSMHLHNGLASSEVDRILGRPPQRLREDDAAVQGLDDAVRVLYSWVPVGSSVLDFGCGWCGAAALLQRERAAKVRGVSVAAAQASPCVSEIRLSLSGISLFPSAATTSSRLPVPRRPTSACGGKT